MINHSEEFDKVILKHKNLKDNLSRSLLIQKVVDNKEAFITSSGALATWTTAKSTGRSPKDTYIVDNEESTNKIDWTSPNNNKMDEELFLQIYEEALNKLSKKEVIYKTDRVVSADSKYALKVTTTTDKALTALFTYNMFRELPDDFSESVFKNRTFKLIALPFDTIDFEKYNSRLPEDKQLSGMVLAMDYDRMLGVVIGSSYCGSIKKLIFTVMNYLLPDEGILPLHCSANESEEGNVTVLMGLSGTGKTTLSADVKRKLIGDDEHGWSDNGIANFENGCYAKLINLNPKKEPEIAEATFTKRDVLENGCIIENAMMYPNGEFDLNDERLTANSRTSFPLTFMKNIKDSSFGGHPNKIILLTADANGVIPPVAKLTKEQAMLWFLMGYTSKLAGTETGIIEPKTTFSRFFGEPFMPRNPGDYTKLFGEKIEKHNCEVYLLNTGWSGGPYGTGSRMDIALTRQLLNNILDGEMDNVEFTYDKRFHFSIPKNCKNVELTILDPENTWDDKIAFEERADKLAQSFSDYFDKAYGNSNIQAEVKESCPGK